VIQRFALWIRRLEIRPGHQCHRALGQASSGILTGDSLARASLPPGFGLAVIHHHIAIAQPTGGAEVQHAPSECPLERNSCVAEWAIRDGNWHTTHDVVDDFVSGQNLRGIGPRVVANAN